MSAVAAAAALHLPLLFTPAATSSSSSSPSLPSGFKLPHCSVSISPYFSRKVALWRRPVVVQARYGGGRSRDSRQGDFEQDSALDISSIRSPSVRLIDVTQNMVGVVSKNEAIRMAEDAELNLVIVSPDADPPVVRIMDYKKYRYEQQKKKRDQQKKSAASRIDMKELKMGYNIDSHDYLVRLRAAQKFLKDGDKVKVIVNLKGRENQFRNIAIELIKRFQDDVGELATEESKNFRERNIYLVLVPNKTIQQKASQDQVKKKEKTVTAATTTV